MGALSEWITLQKESHCGRKAVSSGIVQKKKLRSSTLQKVRDLCVLSYHLRKKSCIENEQKIWEISSWIKIQDRYIKN